MGSWNQTCCISNLPIAVWDRAECLFLIRSEKFKEDWSPIGLPISGSYADYGLINIDLLSDIEEKLLLKKLNDAGITGNISEILEKVNQKDQIYTSILGYKYEILPVLILEDVWNEILKINIVNFKRDNLSCEELFNSALDWIQISENEIYKNIDNKSELFSLALDFSERFMDNLFIRSLYNTHHISSLRDLRKEIYSQLLNNVYNRNLFHRYLRRLSEMIIIEEVMYQTRRKWYIPAGRGSQELNYDIHLKLNKIICFSLNNSKERMEKY